MSKRNLSFAIILLFSFLRPNSYCHGGDPDGGFDIDIHNAFSGSFAVEYSLWENFSVLGQINGHTSPYGPDIRSLSDDALQILFGIKYRFLKNAVWQISFTEDIGGVTVSDFAIQTGIVFCL